MVAHADIHLVQCGVSLHAQGALVLPLQFRSLNSLSWLGGSSALAIVVAMGLIFADIIEQDAANNGTRPPTSMLPPADNGFLTVRFLAIVLRWCPRRFVRCVLESTAKPRRAGFGVRSAPTCGHLLGGDLGFNLRMLRWPSLPPAQLYGSTASFIFAYQGQSIFFEVQ